MSATTLELADLQAHQRPDGVGFDIVAYLDTPGGGRQAVTLHPIALLRYEEFQVAVMEATGLLYRHELCEGRDYVSANEKWRQVCAFIRPIPAAAPETLN